MIRTEATETVRSPLIMVLCPSCERGHLFYYNDGLGEDITQCNHCRREWDIEVTIRERKRGN